MSSSAPSWNFTSQEDWTFVVFHLLCPCLGCLVATAMFAAPIADLRQALLCHALGDLNPRPWAVMTGNCLGWCAYAYYTRNPFILASNVAGFVLSMWLNVGAAKLQYHEMTMTLRDTVTRSPGGVNFSSISNHRPVPLLHVPNDPKDLQEDDKSPPDDGDERQYSRYYHPQQQQLTMSPKSVVFTPQEVWWLSVLIIWTITLVWVGWISPFFYRGYQAETVGLLVNANLIFFYGAPLQTMKQVVESGNSNSIHLPTMFMGIGNATFWLLYGMALWDPVVMLPNSLGLILALGQALLCLVYPHSKNNIGLQRRRRGGEDEGGANGGVENDEEDAAISMIHLPSSSWSSSLVTHDGPL